MMSMARRGFSLMEIMMVIALLAVTTLSIVLSSRNAGSRASARGLSMVLAEQLRMARQQAVTKQYPVALCLPSDGGRVGHTAGYYVLEGETAPRMTDSKDLRGEFPRAAAFVGLWNITSGTLGKLLPVPGSAPGVSLNDWLPAASKRDYCFVFQPDGSLITNDLPSYDGAYHVLVVAGLQVSGAAAPPGASTVTPGPNYFRADAVGECYTLTVSTGGSVSLSAGVQGGTMTSLGSLALPLPATPPPRTPRGTTDPVVEAINFEPQPNPATVPPDTDTVIGPDDFVTLEAVAYDLDGDQLYCMWEVTPLSGTDPGIFSFPGNSGRMDWDPNYVRSDGNRGAWRAVWQWRPPPGVVGSERFELACKVAQEGAPPVTAEIRKIQTLPPGNILFESDRNGGAYQTWQMREDGSQQRLLETDRGQSAQPTANVDGSRVAFIDGDDIWLQRRPLGVAERLTNTPGDREALPALSPTGNLVAFKRNFTELWVMEATTGGQAIQVDTVNEPTKCAVDPFDIDRLSWDPSGTQLLYHKGGQLWKAQINVDPAAGPSLASTTFFTSMPNPVLSPMWSQDGSRVYYVRHDGDPYVWSCDAGGGGDVVYSGSVGVADHQPYRSPVSNQLALTRHPVGSTACQIFRSDAPGNFVQLTSVGLNTFPVWTR